MVQAIKVRSRTELWDSAAKRYDGYVARLTLEEKRQFLIDRLEAGKPPRPEEVETIMQALRVPFIEAMVANLMALQSCVCGATHH